MVELATIATGTTYTGNEPWVAEIEKYDMIYLETDFGSIGSNWYTLGTEIYSSASFKKLLDEGRTGKDVWLLIRAYGTYGQWVRLTDRAFNGSLKIYGVKL